MLDQLRESIVTLREKPTLENWQQYCIAASKAGAVDKYLLVYCPWTGCMHLECGTFYCYFYTQVTVRCSDNNHSDCDSFVGCSLTGVKLPEPWPTQDFKFACLCVCHFFKFDKDNKATHQKVILYNKKSTV